MYIMKSKKLKIAFTAATLMLGIIFGVALSSHYTVGTSATTPGSVSDPVVTKSYVDEQIKKLTGSSVSTGNSSNQTSQTPQSSNTPASNATLEVVSVNSGQTLMLLAGSEAVIRAGKGIAYSGDTNGLSDLTAGQDISPGKSVPSNHLIWFPRDGRGITADPNVKSALTVLVKGPYYIQ